jgi:hypothetical protein
MAAHSSTAASAASASTGFSLPPAVNELITKIPLTPNQLAAVGAATGAALLAYGLDKSYNISHDIGNFLKVNTTLHHLTNGSSSYYCIVIGYIRKMFAVMSNLKTHMKNNVTTADLWEDTVSKWPKKVPTNTKIVGCRSFYNSTV